jgi:PAS domain S-box-containing protein
LWAGGYFVAAVAMAAFAFVYWTNRNVRGMQYLLVGSLVASVQSLCYVMALLAPSLATKALLVQLFTALGAAVVVLWYLFAVTWTQRERLARRPVVALVAAPLAVTVGLLATNATPAFSGYHSLYWSSVGVGTAAGPVAPLTVANGLAAQVASVYAAALVAMTVALLARFSLDPDERLYRWRNALLVAGSVTALLFGVGVALIGVAYRPEPFVYVLANTFLVVGVVRFGIYDVVSLPENALIEAIDGGVLVYSRDGTVIDVNRAAEHVLGVSEDVIGRDVVAVVETAEMLPGVRGVSAAADDAGTDRPAAVAELLDGCEFTVGQEDAPRTFLVRVSALTEDDGDHLGWTVLLYDVTDLRQKQQELDLLKQVLSRVLRHNVRNDLSVVKANAQMLADDATGLEAERLQTIMDKSDNLLDASEKARTVERLLDGERSRSEFDVVEMASDAVAATREEFPNVEFETSLPDACEVHAHWALATAVENVVENAAMHNDADQPRVRVGVQCEAETVTLAVADNGPGIPYKELSVLERGEETPLEHASSVGLWLVSWIIDLSGADIDFENTARGCTVRMSLEPATEDASDDGAAIPGAVDLGLDRAPESSPGDD